MDAAKIRLSPEEMELVCEPGWILTKNRIIQRTQQLLSDIQVRLQPFIAGHQQLPAEILRSSPRISKGENYGGLPWVVLDYPRHFDKENVFAIRTMFWWGHFFSCTLHLAGKYQQRYRQNVKDSFSELKSNGFFACINKEQWEHHFEPDNYAALAGMLPSQFEAICEKPFIKLAKKIPVEEWNGMEEKLPEIFHQFMSLLRKT